MRLITFTVLDLFAIGVAAAASSVAAPPAFAIRPDWTTAAQGDRIYPRLETTAPLDGAKTVELRYGPWTLYPGQILSKNTQYTPSPCRNCFVTAMQYTSRYDDGREILTSDGIWMHHCVLSSHQRATSLTPLGSNIIWAGGNERPSLRLNTRYRYGIDWPDTYNFKVEYMSALQRPVNVSLAITFEYIEKFEPVAREYRDSYLIWNSVGTPRYRNGSYSQQQTFTYRVPKSGVLLQGMGHMHDGGTHVDLYIDNRLACSSRMWYNNRPGYGTPIDPRTGRSLNPPGFSEFGGGEHISDPGQCTSFGHVEQGSVMRAVAYYNTKKYPVMNHKGKVEEQMGIFRVFIGPDQY